MTADIDEADRRRVLERFYRTELNRQREGVGLGLSLVSAICTLQDFSLTIGDNHPVAASNSPAEP